MPGEGGGELRGSQPMSTAMFLRISDDQRGNYTSTTLKKTPNNAGESCAKAQGWAMLRICTRAAIVAQWHSLRTCTLLYRAAFLRLIFYTFSLKDRLDNQIMDILD
jgi:hypothetical protein